MNVTTSRNIFLMCANGNWERSRNVSSSEVPGRRRSRKELKECMFVFKSKQFEFVQGWFYSVLSVSKVVRHSGYIFVIFPPTKDFCS